MFIIDLSRKARRRSAVRNIEIRFSLKEKLEFRVCKWFFAFVTCSDPGGVSDALGCGSEGVWLKDLVEISVIYEVETKKTGVDRIMP